MGMISADWSDSQIAEGSEAMSERASALVRGQFSAIRATVPHLGTGEMAGVGGSVSVSLDF
jgi:hypothetical protein